MIAIIAVLIASLPPVVQAAREAARRMQCTNNLKQLGPALHNHHPTLGAYPSAGRVADGTNYGIINNPTAPGHFRISAMLRMLPCLEQGAASNAMNFQLPLYDINGGDLPRDTTVSPMKITSFICPSDVRDTRDGTEYPRNYAACPGDGPPGSYGSPDGVIYLDSTKSFASIADGTSQAALMSESIVGPSASNTPTGSPNPQGVMVRYRSFSQIHRIFSPPNRWSRPTVWPRRVRQRIPAFRRVRLDAHW